MQFNMLASFFAALFCCILAGWAFLGDRKSITHRALAAGLTAIALEQLFSGLNCMGPRTPEPFGWEHWMLLSESLSLGPWLYFSMVFARERSQTSPANRRLIFFASLPPVLLTVLFASSLFIPDSMAESNQESFLLLGWAGKLFYVLVLLVSVLVLLNLERTLRASFGAIRWRIKFMIFGVAVFFTMRIYTASETILFSSVSPSLISSTSISVILGCFLIAVSLLRKGAASASVYISEELMSKSFTLLVVGGYLIVVGFLAKVAAFFDFGRLLLQNAFFVFLGFIGVAVLLFSDQLNHETRKIIHRNFRRPRHDYRKIWSTFTERLNSLTDIKDICTAVVKTVSEVFGAPAVSIWLFDSLERGPELCCSSALSHDSAETKRIESEVSFLMLTMRNQGSPIDLSHPAQESDVTDVASDAREAGGYQGLNLRYCAPLAVGSSFLGIMTVSDRSTRESFTTEDIDLLKAIAEHAAGILLNHQLFQRLAQAKEMEAFQTMSTFFVHDLKNLASSLSLTFQNLPLYYDNPDFRKDALQTVSRSVDKINSMCSRLSQVNQTLEIQPIETDLNALVRSAASSLNGAFKSTLVEDLADIPKVAVDEEQIQKVITNLLLNAEEAVSGKGAIILSTRKEGGSVVVSVCDNGCGMSKEFIQRALFHPFKTTKKKGLGIGLFQSKMIVEAHKGRIRVVSKEGEGSTFSVVLPISDNIGSVLRSPPDAKAKSIGNRP